MGYRFRTFGNKANSFDEALKEARQINTNYNTGQVKG